MHKTTNKLELVQEFSQSYKYTKKVLQIWDSQDIKIYIQTKS